ncbi:MAG: hypothetical protein AAB361_03275 [Patescibacteria group bacterium]
MSFIWIAPKFGEPKKHTISEEIKEQIPLPKLMEAVLPYQTSIYITVLNIIQCIALAFWINEARDVITKDELTLVCALRLLVALVVIFIVWHRYISELQYLWPISWGDTLNPFLMGIIECVIVFSNNSKTVSLGIFILVIALIQAWTSFTYFYGYLKRKKETTEKLYKMVYLEYPQFVSHLTLFLKNFDWWHFKIFLFSSAVSLLFIVFIALFPNNFNEIIFPIIFLIQMIQGEIINNFQVALYKDKSIDSYFQ